MKFNENSQNIKVALTEKALSMAIDIITQQKLPVLYCNTNLTDIQIVQKIVSLEAGIDIKNLKSGLLNDHEYKSILNVVEKIYEAPLYICEYTYENIEQRKETFIELSKKENIKIIFIDYEKKDKDLVNKIIDGTVIPIIAIENEGNNI
jgi:replicative DNA helicase